MRTKRQNQRLGAKRFGADSLMKQDSGFNKHAGTDWRADSILYLSCMQES